MTTGRFHVRFSECAHAVLINTRDVRVGRPSDYILSSYIQSLGQIRCKRTKGDIILIGDDSAIAGRLQRGELLRTLLCNTINIHSHTLI